MENNRKNHPRLTATIGLVFSIAAMSCAATKRSTRTHTPANPKTQASVSPDLENPRLSGKMTRRCADLPTEALARATEQPATTDGEIPQETVSEMLRLVDEGQKCDELGLLNSDEKRRIYLAARYGMERWYASSILANSAALSGERSALQRIDDVVQAVPQARSVAESAIFVHLELEKLNAESDRLEDADSDRMLRAMLLVDACSGVILNMLDQRAEAGAGLENIIRLWQEAIFREEQAWARDRIPNKKPGENASYWPQLTTPLLPGSQDKEVVELGQRILQLSSVVRNIASVWGDRSNDNFRDDFGRPYAKYLQALYDASSTEEKRLYQWVVPVEELTENGYEQTIRVPLDKLVRETAYDDYNTRALFAMRQAESDLVALLDPAAKTGSVPQLVSASYDLLDAAQHTDSLRAMMNAVTRVIRASGLLDGSEVFARSEADADDTAGITLRRAASRQLAELGICLMNRALLADGGRERPCVVSLDPRSETTLNQAYTCDAAELATRYSAESGGIRPIPEPTRLAYESVISALELNWTLSEQAFGATPSTASICELKRLVTIIALGRLAVRMKSYSRIVSLLASRRLTVEPRQMGPLLSQAFTVGEREQRGVCVASGLSTCNAESLQNALSSASSEEQPRLSNLRDRYCETALRGREIYRKVVDTSSGTSLLQQSHMYLQPLTARQFRARGESFTAEAAVCVPTGTSAP